MPNTLEIDYTDYDDCTPDDLDQKSNLIADVIEVLYDRVPDNQIPCIIEALSEIL